MLHKSKGQTCSAQKYHQVLGLFVSDMPVPKARGRNLGMQCTGQLQNGTETVIHTPNAFGQPKKNTNPITENMDIFLKLMRR